MQATPDQIRARLLAAINASEFDTSSLARRIKRGQDYIRDFLNSRKDSIKAADLAAIETALSLTHGSLTRPDTDEDAIVAQIRTSFKNPRRFEASDPFDNLEKFLKSETQANFPIFSSTDGDNGVMTVSSKPLIMVPHPWFMRGVEDAFGMIVSALDAEPYVEMGVTLMVNPALPALITSNILLQTPPDENGSRVVLRKLLQKKKTHWRVMRLSDEEVEEYDRAEWPNALRIVGQVDDF